MRGRALLATVSVAAGLAAPAATAADEPWTFTSVGKGSLGVTSGVVVLEKAVELKGAWNDDAKPCKARRTLRVTTSVFYSSPGGVATKQKRLRKTGRARNCAEGGPNFGFLFKAKKHGFACPDGTWKPGSYSFSTETRDRKSKLEAGASLGWVKISGSC